VTLAVGQRVDLLVTFMHARGDIDVRLINDRGSVVASSNSTNDQEQIEYTATEAGRYRVQIFGYQSASNQITATLTLSDTALPEPEPDSDADGDGISDDEDLCANTPAGARVWHSGQWRGCAGGQSRNRTSPGDADGDGITDDRDRCSGTPSGARVWRSGQWVGCSGGQHRDR